MAGLVEQLVEAGRAQHAQAGRLREVRDQHVGQAGPEPVELRVAGEVVEVEDGDGAPPVLRGGGGLAAQEESRHRGHDDERRADRDGQRPAPAAGGRGHEPLAARRGAEGELPAVDVALEVLEVAAQVARGLVAVLGPLLERALDHAREGLRDVVADLAGRPRRVLEDRGENGEVGVAAEGALPRGHLVEQDPEREDVGAVVHRQALSLLRRHVGDRAHDTAVLGDRLRLLGGPVALVAVVAQLGEAEVQHLQPPVRGQHHVLGLQVAVEDALPVGRGHRVGHGDGEREEALHREAARRDRLAERLALDELHRQEAEPVLLLEGAVEGDDAGVAQRGDRLRLALEALDLLGVRRHLGRQHLEGHAAVEPGVERQVDVAHAPRADRLEDAVRAESPAHEAAVGLRHSHVGDYDARSPARDPAVTSVHMESVALVHRVEPPSRLERPERGGLTPAGGGTTIPRTPVAAAGGPAPAPDLARWSHVQETLSSGGRKRGSRVLAPELPEDGRRRRRRHHGGGSRSPRRGRHDPRARRGDPHLEGERRGPHGHASSRGSPSSTRCATTST